MLYACILILVLGEFQACSGVDNTLYVIMHTQSDTGCWSGGGAVNLNISGLLWC